ncbi:MAG: SH3 domain-containing protein [Chloroflexi bacterium]|nr:SH3 domain-containing protein [Chloroflexota bacterium]
MRIITDSLATRFCRYRGREWSAGKKTVFRSVVYVLGFCAVLLTGLALSSPGAAFAVDLTVGGGAVVTDELNLRGGPSAENPIVDVLPSGTALRLLAGPVNDVWWRVTDGARVGYVNGAWLAPAAPPDDTAAFDLDLMLPFHRQMTAVWCDPADLQSWIEFVQGQSLGPSVDVQQRLWDWELSHNAGFTVDQWNASPFAVASAARHWLPDRGFNHFIYDDPTAATTTVAWLLANPAYREPSIALIWAADHYVLVRGVRATADPFLNYPQAKVLGVYVMDPNQGGPSWLGEDRYIPLSDWVGRYLTPVSYLTPASGVPGDVWQGKYVMVQRDWSNDDPTLAGRVNASAESYEAADR